VNALDFGRYLAQQRDLRGLSRTEVVNATKISEAAIGSLEAGEMNRLPNRLYVLKFIRAYAEAIGLDPEETVLRYEEIDPSEATLAFNAAAVPVAAAVPASGPVSDLSEPSPGTAKRPPSWAAVSALKAGQVQGPTPEKIVRPRPLLLACVGVVAAAASLMVWFRLHG